jgi:hypothetical protein
MSWRKELRRGRLPAADSENVRGICSANSCSSSCRCCATGEEVAPEVHADIVEAVATPADPVLDAFEERLNAAEAKVDSLLGK